MGLAFKNHRLLYHSTLGLRLIKEKTKNEVDLMPNEQSESSDELTLLQRQGVSV